MKNDQLRDLGLRELEDHELKEVQRTVEELSIWRVCATIEAVNWTPWWGGDYRAKVRDPDTLKVTSLPTSETLKGVVRWVLRAAVNTYLNTNIETLDQVLAPIYGGVLEIGRGGRREEHLDSLVRLVVDTHLEESRDHKSVQLVANAIKRSGWQRINNQAYNSLGENIPNKYYKIVTTPRLELAFMGREDPKTIISYLPVPSECITLKVRVEISRNLEAKVSKYYRENIPTESDICILTLLALIYALMVKGIGRGANRGFGRFYITNLTKHGKLLSEEDYEELKSIIKGLNLKVSSVNEFRKTLKELHEALVDRAKVLLGLKGLSIRKCNACSPSLKPIDDISHVMPGTYIELIDNAKHPAPVPLRLLTRRLNKKAILDVYDALSAIGKAFMKNVWKRYCKVVNYDIKSSGIGFHSWIAGLPRSQLRKGKVDTGYVITDASIVGGDNICLKANQLTLEKFDPGRRASSIIAYPAYGKPNTIVIITYITKGDHDRIINKLYHIGRHGDPRFSPPCRHVVKVSWASNQRQVPFPKGNSQKCRVQGGLGCGGDRPAGVVYPNRFGPVNSQQLIEKVYESVLEHIRNVLS